MTCFRYQVYMWFRNHQIFEWLHIQHYVKCFAHRISPTPHQKTALPNLYRQHYICNSERTLIWLNCHYLCQKAKIKNCLVEEPSHVRQLALNHVCKIGLMSFYKKNVSTGGLAQPFVCYNCVTDSPGPWAL